MKIDGGLTGDLAHISEGVRRLEAAGYDGAMVPEMAHDPFFPLLLAAEHSERIELLTSIAVAFSRSPMTLAATAHDLNAYSKGRFILGLGSQIKAHITRRFSMPWSSPAARMKEFILALHAIWDNWYEGKPLRFEGRFYSHTLMTPMFTPTDTGHGRPRVFLAAVGPLMTRVAAEVADGLILHSFTTERYLREVTLPMVEEGLARSGRTRDQFEISYPAFVVTGDSDEARAASHLAVTRQLAFYASTPTYAPVLDLHGWGELQPRLTAMSKRGEWEAMGEEITGEILDAFAIVAEPDAVVERFLARCGDVVDRTTLALPARLPEQHAEMLARVKG